MILKSMVIRFFIINIHVFRCSSKPMSRKMRRQSACDKRSIFNCSGGSNSLVLVENKAMEGRVRYLFGLMPDSGGFGMGGVGV